MASFSNELPTNIIKQCETLYNNTENMIGKMTQAGANVVLNNIIGNVPKSFNDSDIMNCLKITKVYKTPSDSGINTKVGFYGYFTNDKGVKTPAPLVCNLFEYGSSKNNYPKNKFLYKSFVKTDIEKAMTSVQNTYLED